MLSLGLLASVCKGNELAFNLTPKVLSLVGVTQLYFIMCLQ